jgi:hypothetical protein
MNQTLEEMIVERLGRRVLADVADVSALTGIPEQTIRNRMCQRTWPIRILRIGRRIYMKVTDLVHALESDSFASLRKRGRPRAKARHSAEAESRKQIDPERANTG